MIFIKKNFTVWNLTHPTLWRKKSPQIPRHFSPDTFHHELYYIKEIRDKNALKGLSVSLSEIKVVSFTFPHQRYIPVWLLSKNTSLEFREVASAGTSMVFVLNWSVPWTWNNLTGGSGSEDPFLDVPPYREEQKCPVQSSTL